MSSFFITQYSISPSSIESLFVPSNFDRIETFFFLLFWKEEDEHKTFLVDEEEEEDNNNDIL
jgi:hypothetical protein